MADLRARIGVKIVDPTTDANEAGVDASGNVQVILASNTGVDIGDVDIASFAAADTDADDDVVAAAQTSLRTINLLYGYDGTQWERVQTDAAGALDTTITTALPGGTNNIGDVDVLTLPSSPDVEVDDAAVSVGGNLFMNGLVFDDTTPVVVEEGDAGYQRMSLNRNAYTVIRDDAGNERGANVTASNELSVLASAQPGVDIGDVDILSVVPGVGATNLGKAEDAAHVDGDTGVMLLAVRRDADTVMVTADNDYSPLQTDVTGRLKVETQGGGGGTALVDDVTFTAATDSYTPIGGFLDETTPNNLEENDGGAVRMTANRAFHTVLRDGAGNERSANVTAANELNVLLGSNSGVDIGDVDILSGPTGASSLEVQGPAASGASSVGDPVQIGGIEGANIRSVAVDASGHLQVDVLSGGGASVPSGPTINLANSTNTAAGSSANLDSAEITEAEKLYLAMVSASVPFKVQFQAVEDGTPRNLTGLLFGRANEMIEYRPPHPDFATHAGAAAGLDVFRAVMFNMDGVTAADLHATFHYAT